MTGSTASCSFTESRSGRVFGETDVRDGEEIELMNVAYDDDTRRLRADFLHEEGGSSTMIRLTASLTDNQLRGWGGAQW